MALTLDIFIHMDAVNRNEWTGAGDDRPLTDLGRQQSQRIAEELTAAGPIAALYSSPALRCRDSLVPLAEKTGLAVQVAPGFRDTSGYKAPPGWERGEVRTPDPLGGALSAGSAWHALQDIRRGLPDGSRAVLCSYGDIVPALLAFVAGAYTVDMPPRLDAKGALYTIVIDDQAAKIAHRGPSGGFPA